MLITAITSQKRRKDRMNVFLDGKFAFSLPLELIVKYKLKIDQEISEDLVNKLIKENDYKIWFDQALKFLSYRPRSQKEVVNYLVKKEVGFQTRSLILEKLVHLNFLDDQKFAQWFIEQRMRFRPKGRKLIELELRQKGIEKDIIENAFTYFSETNKEASPALALIVKKLPLWKKLEPIKIRQKIQGFLLRRGFDWDDINTVLHHLKDEKAI